MDAENRNGKDAMMLEPKGKRMPSRRIMVPLILSSFALAGCATAKDIRTREPNLSFEVQTSQSSHFIDCLHDQLQVSDGGIYTISRSRDGKGITHMMARFAGHNAANLFEWEVTARPMTKSVLIQRRSNKTLFGQPMGAVHLRQIATSCAEQV